MKKCAFISRPAPTGEQAALAAKAGFVLDPVGDRDAFSVRASDYPDHDAFCVVHPAAALRLALGSACVGGAGKPVLIFENSNREPEGTRPGYWKAKALHVFQAPAQGEFGTLESNPGDPHGLTEWVEL